MIKLNIKNRETKVKLADLKKIGEIPGVYYGAKKENTPISFNLIDFIKVFREAGESTSVTLSSPKGDVDVLIHEVQQDPVGGQPIHVDFYAVQADKMMEVTVPLEFIGVSPAIKSGLGILVKVLREVEVESLPKNLPHNINVDISGLLAIDDHILVKDLVLPNGVKMLTKGDEIVVSIAHLQEEEKEEALPVDLGAIEVEKKGKKEEEEEKTA